MTNGDLVKVRFKLDTADWHGHSSETLWAKPLKGKADVAALELENSPFYCKGVSYLDVVRARYRDGQYEFAGVVSRSGHSTYRLIIDQENVAFRLWWKKLQDLGCTYESGEFRGKKLFTVDVPVSADIYAVYRVLEEGEKEKIWLFEEGHVGHRLTNAQSEK
jgi:Domain of unknown function (DUF4265)